MGEPMRPTAIVPTDKEKRTTDADGERWSMQFEWDEEKRKLNWRRHHVDFAYAALMFGQEYLTRIDDREDYGEERLISIGMVDGECFVVVHTDRVETVRIISARKAGKHEREEYYARFLRGASGS